MSRYEVLAVIIISGLGFAIRAVPVVSADFPLNDGGLFYQMVRDLNATWPALPAITTYNDIQAPFAYPPLAFYLGSALHGALGVDVLRVIPVAAASLTVPAFHLLARSVAGGGLHAVAATFMFAVMPRTFEWMTMGGGLTRAPGLLLAILTLWMVHRFLTGPGGVTTATAAGVVGGLTALAHPQAALFTVLSGMLFVVWHVREPRELRFTACAVGAAALVVGPWIATITARGQLEAVIGAGATQPGPLIGLLSLVSFDLTGSELFDIVGLFAALGLLLGLLRRTWLIPIWLGALMVLDARGGATYAAIPASMLAGTAFVEFVIAPFWISKAPPVERRLRRLPLGRTLLAAGLIGVAVIDAFGSQEAPSWPGVALNPAQRAAIAESGATAPDGRYLVVSGRFWATDATAEWFPVLSGATSIATVQGYEWLDRDVFRDRLLAAEELRDCANAGGDCLAAWAETWDREFSHVFVPKGSLTGTLGEADCCTGLRELLRLDDRYDVIHDGPGATIFERIDG